MTDFEGALERYYLSIISEGDVVFDIGAHTGRHTVPLSRAVGRSGFVLAVEPLQAMVRELRERELSNVEVVAAACSARSMDRATFTYVPEFPGYSGFRRRTYPALTAIELCEVNVATLDDLARGLSVAPRYVKIDVEGAEYLVLLGSRELLSGSRPVISIESGAESLSYYDHTAADVFDLLACSGYVVLNIEGERLSRSQFVESNIVQRVWDYILIPSENEEMIDRSIAILQRGVKELRSIR